MRGTESMPQAINRFAIGFPNRSTVDIWDEVILCCGLGYVL